jgi:hypothetical protein
MATVITPHPLFYVSFRIQVFPCLKPVRSGHGKRLQSLIAFTCLQAYPGFSQKRLKYPYPSQDQDAAPFIQKNIGILNIAFNLISLGLLFRLGSIIRRLQPNPGFVHSPESFISFKGNCCQMNVGHAVLCPTYRVALVSQYPNQIDVVRYIIV